MKTRLLLAVLVCSLLCACDKPMTNDEIIAEKKKCDDAGMTPQIIYSGWTYEVMHLQCMVKEEK